MNPLESRVRAVIERIELACHRSKRNTSEVELVAVTKGRTIEEVAALYSLGLRDFGESRLQDAEPKIAALPRDVRWHFVGPLQSNKAKRVGSTFHVVHSIDSVRQLDEIAKQMNRTEVYVQVNVASEPQKSGLPVADVESFVEQARQHKGAALRGLMTIGPNLDDPEGMRPYFRSLAELARQCSLPNLSMGMSGDFEVAIEEGATSVRVGSAIFE